MVQLKGRLGFRQYMPAKPIKWGIKVWALSVATTGYGYHLQVYTGKAENKEEKPPRVNGPAKTLDGQEGPLLHGQFLLVPHPLQ